MPKLAIALEPILDGTGTINTPAGYEVVVSSGSQTSGTPKLTYDRYVFGQSADTFVVGHFRVPDDYASGGVIGFEVGSDVTSGNFRMIAGVEPFDVSSTDTDAAVYNAADASSATSVPGTAGQVKNLEITLTMTGVAAGEVVSVFLGRDPDHAADTAAGDVWVLCDSIYFEYA